MQDCILLTWHPTETLMGRAVKQSPSGDRRITYPHILPHYILVDETAR